MPMHKIEAPAGPIVHGPYDHNRPELGWWVEGVLFTDNAQIIDYSRDSGFPVEPAEPTPEYLAAVESLKDQAKTGGHHSAVATQDALDPNRRNYL